MLQSARLPLQQILWKDVKCVTQALHDDELMQHMLLLQSGSHLLRQSEWNVSILIAMQKQGWPVDVIAGHFYPTGKGGPDKRIKQIQMFQKDLARYKAPKSADQWDTEANFWTTVPGEPYAGRVRGAKAATYLARNYLDTWRTGLKRSYWYMWTVGDQDLRFPGVQLRTGDPATTAFQNLGAWTIGAKYKSCTTKGKLVQCSFTKSGKSFVIAFTTKGSATVKANSKQVCPVYGGSCTTGTSKQKVTTLPVKIG